MAHNGRNIRMNKQQIEIRRKRRRIKFFLFFVRLLILLALIFCIRNIYFRLEEIQAELKRLEVRQYSITQTSAEIQPTGQTDGINYSDSIDAWDVGKPIDRSGEEVLQRLSELAQNSPVIKEVYQNHSQYPDELLAALANNPEMADFVAGYPNGNGVTGGITASEKEQEFPLFLQWDPRWGYKAYGESCIGMTGCGPTCLSMVLFYLTGDETLTPDVIAKYSAENGYYVAGTGTSWALMKDVPGLYGVGVSEINLSETNMRAALDNGDIIICAMRRGTFTTSGHYIVIYGYDADGFMVNDPNCIARSNERWSFSDIQYQISNIWSYRKAV